MAAAVFVLPVNAENAVAPVLLKVQVVDTQDTPPPVNVNAPVVALILATLAPPATAEIIPLDIVIVVPSGFTAPNVDVVATGRSAGAIARTVNAPVAPFGVARNELAVKPRVAVTANVPFVVNGDPATVKYDGIVRPMLVSPAGGGPAHPVALPLARMPFANCPAIVQRVGVTARLVAVAALPVVF